MGQEDKRAHGVTPGLSRDYSRRTAGAQAAFLLPHLRPGMKLLDVGCGPGTISVGLASTVSPGQVIGIDHDGAHIEEAKALAGRQGTPNVFFRTGDALSLPFPDGVFEAAFENDLLTHIPEQAVRAAEEVWRVLKPGGLFAARDLETNAVLWGHPSEPIALLNKLMIAWQRSRGSDVTLGKRLPSILRKAGFTGTIKSVSADTKGDPEAVRSHARASVYLLDGPFGRDILDKGWAEQPTIERLKDSVRQWGEHPDAFFANVHVEVIGWKPGGASAT
jgi:ubiquinone/menaquinone biosynthesis C-methylase UbiE